MTRRRRGAGQGTVELVAGVPVLCLTLVLAWQVLGAAWAAVRAEEGVRRAGLRAVGPPDRALVVTSVQPLPGPLAAGLRAEARATVLP